MPVKKILLIAIPVLLCVVGGLIYYEYNKPQPDIAELSAQPVRAIDLYKDFISNEVTANKSYLHKVLRVSGKILEVKHNQNEQLQIILDAGDPMFGIACTIDNPRKIVKPGDQVTIKGICTGYLNDVILIKSLLLN